MINHIVLGNCKMRNRIVFHRGYNILADKYGTYTLLPLNVITIAGLKNAAEVHGHNYMYNSHPHFSSLAECQTYIDTHYPQTTDTKAWMSRQAEAK